MKLGNTAGKNKGKKYLKIKGSEVITAENQGKADHFKYWFGENYARLCRELAQKDTLDSDIMNETFLRIHDKILYGGLVIKDYKAYFHRAFFTNYMQVIIDISKGILSSVDGYDTTDDSDDDEPMIRTKTRLENDILDYIYEKYPVRDFELFKMYVSLKPAINYEQLAGITNISQSRISETISKIRKDVRANKVFLDRREATLRGWVD